MNYIKKAYYSWQLLVESIQICGIYSLPVADDIAYLCLNGCITFYKGECISKEVMDAELARKLITTIQNDSNTEVLVSGEKDMLYYSEESKLL